MLGKRATRALNLFVVSVLLAVVLASLVKYDFSFRLIWRDARIAAHALKVKYGFQLMYRLGMEKYRIYDNLWYKTDRTRSGVTVNDRKRASRGLTFYSNHDTSAFLIDMEGNIIHQWHKPFSEVWPDPKHLISPVPDDLVYWRKAKLLPDGDIIAIYEGINQAPYGGGIIKLDKESNLIWKLDINAHHDFHVTDDGAIVALMHSYEKSPVTGNPIISDALAWISAEGKLIRTVRLFDLIYNSRYRDSIDWEKPDMFHTNNVELLPARIAREFPMFEAGDILISMYDPNAVFVLDNSDLHPKWALINRTRHQHDPDFMSDGNIRIFDNMASIPTEEGDDIKVDFESRIIDVNPIGNSVEWSFRGSASMPFYSENRGSQQMLEGGNVLITESTGGRIFEITPSGEMVWEFITPGIDGDSIGIVNWATRHRRRDLAFLEDK